MADLYVTLGEMVVNGDLDQIPALARQALAEGIQPREILDRGLLPGMDIVGQRFREGDMYVPEVLLSARTMHAALDVLRPLLAEGEQAGSETVVIGTVEGDIHNVGKNLVAMLLEGGGFRVVDLGVDVKPDVFVRAVQEHSPSIVAMSALLTTTLPKMGETVQALQEAGVRNRVKIIVGGAPVTEEYAAKIGADGYAPNAVLGVDRARSLLAARG